MKPFREKKHRFTGRPLMLSPVSNILFASFKVPLSKWEGSWKNAILVQNVYEYEYLWSS